MKQKMEALFSNNKVRTIVTVAVTAAIVTIIIGLGSAMAENDQDKELAMISEKAAKEIAFNKTGGGILESLKLDNDDGRSVYEVEIADGDYEYDVKIDAATGEVIGFDQEKIKQKQNVDDAKDIPAVSGTSSGTSTDSSSADKSYIGKTKAKNIALDRVGGGKVISCHLDYDDGRAEYDVKIYYGKYEYELEIDAKTGKILDYDKELQDKYEKDHDHDDDYDDDHDDDHGHNDHDD